jgi:hypothetical protein
MQVHFAWPLCKSCDSSAGAVVNLVGGQVVDIQSEDKEVRRPRFC